MSRYTSSTQYQHPQGRVGNDETIQPTDGLSEYELERRRTIERNHRKLKDLGLVGREKPFQVAMAKNVVKPPRRVSRSAAAPKEAPAAIGVRKSLRMKGKPAPVYRENAVGFDDEGRRRPKRPRPSPHKRHGWETHTSSAVAVPPTAARRGASKPLPPDSSRNLECNTSMLMGRYLGRRFPAFGKAPVMEVSTMTCPPKFSRMSGVTEWKNAVFLWVNVDGGTDYANLFEEDLVLAGVGDGEEKVIVGDPSSPAAQQKGSKERAIERSSDSLRWRQQEERSTSAAAGASALVCQVRESAPSAASLRGSGGKLEDCAAGKGDAANAGNGDGREEAIGGDADGKDAGRSAGLKITWFAGGRMTAESALIHRLVAGGAASETKDKRHGVDAQADTQATSSGAQAANGHDDKPPRDGETTAGSATNVGATAAMVGDASRQREPHLANAHAVSRDSEAKTAETNAGNARPVEIATSANVADRGALERKFLDHTSSAGDDVDGDARQHGDAVLLFCRLPNEPYVFCGRLGYTKHWPAERPVRFIWRLLDAAGLAQWPDFRAIVEAAGIRSDGGGDCC